MAQEPVITVLEDGEDQTDSSYYDIERVGDNEFWAVGKYGIITSLNSEGQTSRIDFPNQGSDLLKIQRLDEDHLLIAADSGYLYFYDQSAQKWEYTRVEGYEESCFYNACKINDVLMVCGGKSSIAAEKKALPFGFILRSIDGGENWEKVFDSKLNMVWSIKYDKLGKELNALLYHPLRQSRLIQSVDFGTSWEKTGIHLKGLFHDFSKMEENTWFSGGQNAQFNLNGAVATLERINNFQTGMFWDIAHNRNWMLATSTDGNLVYRKLIGDWKFMSTAVCKNLYEIAFIDDHTAFVVGSYKTILKISFPK